MKLSLQRFHAAGLLTVGTAALGLIIAGCGGGSGYSARGASAPASATATATAVSATVARPVAHLQIVSPRRGAHTSGTITVRVRLSGVPAHGSAFHYVLDHTRARRGPSQLTLRGVAPGPHRIIVTLAANPSVRASTQFIVRTPPPTVTTTQSLSQTSTTSTFSAPVVTTSSFAPPPPPPTSTTTHTTAPTTTQTSSPGGGIPQGGGGDGDADNSGGPSDGDGAV